MSNSGTLIDRLFAAGSHYGFRKSRRHPTVVPFIFGSKDGNDILDLEQTADLVAAATQFVEEAAKQGKTILFVGTKNEAVAVVKHHAAMVSAPYVVNRWIGGMMSNFSEIKKRINRLETLKHEKEAGELDRKYTKKERVILNREMQKLETNFGGISTLTRPADVMIIVDPRHDVIALDEARDLKIPVIGIMSSDCDVSKVTYPVIVNDALQSSLALVLGELTTAIERGKAAYTPAAASEVVRRPLSRPRRPRTN
jgi:small subunit ribosomal protein S2